jgi:hypothetical protein|tara:strand:- start:524 stop:751 length:228 start_codon:yes stop_codon:yes gene_type:complete
MSQKNNTTDPSTNTRPRYLFERVDDPFTELLARASSARISHDGFESSELSLKDLILEDQEESEAEDHGLDSANVR